MQIGFAVFVLASLLVHAEPASAQETRQDFAREELRIAMPAAGPRGLEALLVRPAVAGRYPLALINHGAPRSAAARSDMTPLAFLPQALEFARRGWAAAVVMRRGYGDSGGVYAEGTGSCQDPDYVASGRAAAADLHAAIAHLAQRPEIDAARIISVGLSAGGFATIALTAEAPAGLVAAISFAGGRGSLRDGEVCTEDRLVAAFGHFGTRSRVPMLWIYSENDLFFGQPLAQRFHAAFTAGGGKVDFIKHPPFSNDGHRLFFAGIPLWTPYVDAFLKRQRLVLRATPLPAPSLPRIPPPPQLSQNGREAFAAFLAAGPHKAFAVSPKGAYGWRTGRRTVEQARQGALEYCQKHDTQCRVVAIDEALAP